MDESGSFSSQRAAQLFQDQALQDRVLDELVAILLEKGYQGLDVDLSTSPGRTGRLSWPSWATPGNGYTRWACRFT